MKNFFLIICGTLVFALVAKAQDTIVKKNGDILKVKITEVGTDEIKFKTFGMPDSPIIVIKKSEVKTIKVGGQTIMDEKEPPKNTSEDILVKKDGSTLKIKVIEIGSNEVKFKLLNDPDGPTISVLKEEIKTLKINNQIVIEAKTDPEDVITKKDGSTLKVKVIEMGNDVVKFQLYNNPEGPLMSLKKSEIKTIKVDGQIVYEYKPDPYSISNNQILDKTSNFKFHFFSPLRTHLAFTYEWMNKPGFNFEAGLGIIGVGVKPVDNFNQGFINPRGTYIRFGPKFLLGNSSEIEIEGARFAHPLKGRYFKVEMILTAMSVRNFIDTGMYTPTRIYYQTKYQSMALHLIYGRQYIYGNAITVGYYAGFGYAFENKTDIGKPQTQGNWYYNYDSPRRFSHIYFGKEFPMSLTGGFTIGYIFKTPDSWKGKKSYKNNPRSK